MIFACAQIPIFKNVFKTVTTTSIFQSPSNVICNAHFRSSMYRRHRATPLVLAIATFYCRSPSSPPMSLPVARRVDDPSLFYNSFLALVWLVFSPNKSTYEIMWLSVEILLSAMTSVIAIMRLSLLQTLISSTGDQFMTFSARGGVLFGTLGPMRIDTSAKVALQRKWFLQTI